MTDRDKALQYVLKNLIIDETQGLIGRCNRCNSLVLLSETSGYSAQCVNHDEDLYGFEWHFADLESVTADEFEDLIQGVINEEII